MIKKNKINPIDAHVGNRMRLRRTMLQMSQMHLAQEMNVTFQQIQKYEKGENRISASRLYDAAQILQVSMNYFYEDIDSAAAQNSPRYISMPQAEKTSRQTKTPESDPLLKEETLQLITAYYRIKNRDIAKNILHLICRLSKTNCIVSED